MSIQYMYAQPDQVCEETGEGVTLIKDQQNGEVIGFERLYYKAVPGPNTVTVETLVGDERKGRPHAKNHPTNCRNTEEPPK